MEKACSKRLGLDHSTRELVADLRRRLTGRFPETPPEGFDFGT